MSIEELEAEIMKLSLKDRAAFAKWSSGALTPFRSRRFRLCGLMKQSAGWMSWNGDW